MCGAADQPGPVHAASRGAVLGRVGAEPRRAVHDARRRHRSARYVFYIEFPLITFLFFTFPTSSPVFNAKRSPKKKKI